MTSAEDGGSPTTPPGRADARARSEIDSGTRPTSWSAGAAEAPLAARATDASAPHAHEPGRGVADIRALVIAHRDEARACYDTQLIDHPGIEGDLVVQWTINPKGNVTELYLDKARSQITEPSVAECVENIVKQIQFAASPGGYETKASYPFNFRPHKRARAAP